MDLQIRRMLLDFQKTHDPTLLPHISQLLGRERIVVTQPLATKKLTHPDLDQIISCSISDDGLLFVTISSTPKKSNLLLWDALTGDLLAEYKNPSPVVEAIFLNSRTLLCVGPTSIFIHDLSTGDVHYLEESSSFTTLGTGIYRHCFNKAKRELFYQRKSVLAEHSLGMIVNIDTGNRVQLKTQIHAPRWSPTESGLSASFLKGNIILIANGTSLEFYDTVSGDLLRRIEHSAEIKSLVVSPDESQCAVISSQLLYQGNNYIGTEYQWYLYDLYSGTVSYTKLFHDSIQICEFSPDSRQILIGLSLPTVGRAQWSYLKKEMPILFLMDSLTGDLRQVLMTSPLREDEAMVRSISFAKFINGGESIIAGDMVSRKLTSSLTIWDTQSGALLSKFGELEGLINHCSISDDSTRLLAGSTKKLRDAEGVGWMAGRYAHGPVINILEMWYLGP